MKKLREDFSKGKLSERDIKKDPFAQFELWMKQATEAGIAEYQATVLSTVSKKGKPTSRIVYLREMENGSLRFYTNYNSKKSRHIIKNKNVCLNFFWADMQRQVRIEGTVSMARTKHSDDYFKNRPKDSQIGAWSSDQSSVLKSRKELETAVLQNAKKFAGKKIPRPEFWGGYEVTPNYYEFWQGRKSRLHDRISFKKVKNKWKITRLAP